MNWILGLDGDVNMNEYWKGPRDYDVGFSPQGLIR